MANTARAGNAAENLVAKDLRAQEAIVGSMRHAKSGGDLLANWPDQRVWLVEVKKAPKRGVLFGGGYFSKAQRQDMRELKARCPHVELWLAWVKGSTITWIPESDWP